MAHRHLKILKYSVALLLVAGALAATAVSLPDNAWARDGNRLQRCLDVFAWYIDNNATIHWRGYHKSSKELAWVKRKRCDMLIKRKIWGNPKPARDTSYFKQYFRVPLHKVDSARMERIDYRHDAGPYTDRPNLEYYGYAVVLKTGFWDIEVINRLGHTITREREFELRFNTERAAREFTMLIASTSRECSIHSLGVGDDWNRVNGR